MVCDKELGKVEPKRAIQAQPLLLRAHKQLEALAEIVTVGLMRAVEWNLASSLPEYGSPFEVQLRRSKISYLGHVLILYEELE